jgi:hypothetical protein
MSLPKRNQSMMLPLNRVARSYEAIIGQAISTVPVWYSSMRRAQLLLFHRTIFENAGSGTRHATAHRAIIRSPVPMKSCA